MTICHIPRVFAEVETVICRSKEAESLVIEELMFRTRHLREMLVDWRRSYEAILLEHFNHTSMQAAIDKRYETLGVGLAMLIVLNRLISALNLDLGNELEDESQSLAHQLLDLESQAYASNARAGIFMALKVMVARATIATTTEWRVCTDPEDWNHSNLTRTASRDVFEHWCSLKGRKTTSYAHVLEQD